MNTKQLANVLVRILGLSMCVGSVPGIITGILCFMQYWWSKSNTVGSTTFGDFYLSSSLASLVLGVLLLAKSRWIVTRLIAKDEE